jgi:nucleoside-diphosphate-sugar epimerase
MSGRTIAIIGGAGFIGTELVRQILLTGQAVRIVDKRISAAYPALCSTADVRDASALRTALRGAGVIFNLAAEHKDNVRPRALYDEVNVQGARNVCQVAAELAIPALVFTSSVAVYGFAAPDTDEKGPLHPFNDYGRTKMEAEGVYREWLTGGTGRMLTIVRPTVVFGPRNRGNVYNLLRQMASGRFAMVGSGNNVKSMAFVENVAGLLAAAANFGPGGYLFNYIDKPDLSMNELVLLVKQCLGLPARIGLRIPYPAAYLGGLAADIASKIFRRALPISAIRVRKFCATTQFGSSRLAGTGFIPAVPIREALARTIAYEFLGGRDRDTGAGELFESE